MLEMFKKHTSGTRSMVILLTVTQSHLLTLPGMNRTSFPQQLKTKSKYTLNRVYSKHLEWYLF